MPEQQEFKKRNTAFRISIGMLMNSEPIFEQERFRALNLNGKEIVRVNLIATVVDKFSSENKPYTSITLDDNTGDIRVKAFADDVQMFQSIEIGDTVIVLGLLRHFNNEIYITPEIIKPVDARWLLARKLELTKEYGQTYETLKAPQEEYSEKQPKETEQEIEEIKINDFHENPEQQEESLRQKLIRMIKEAEAQGGINIEQIILTIKDPVEKINSEVQTLLEEGAIFEPKPGFLRIL